MFNEIALKQIDYIAERCKEIRPLVAIHCITYNHENYLRDALDGFVMQETNFPFVAIVHDDVSTDKTPEILKEYAEKYPDIIFPIFEKENQYSKPDGSLTLIMKEAILKTGAKYVAYCEGDDYWTDPLKLQKQLDFMEANPEYSMCATDVRYEYPDNYIEEPTWEIDRKNDVDINFEQILWHKGGLLATCTFFINTDYYKEMPEEGMKLYVGDYPLKLYMAYRAKIKFLSNSYSIYRKFASGSWTKKNIRKRNSKEKLKKDSQNLNFFYSTIDKITNQNYTGIIKIKNSLDIFNIYKNNSKIHTLNFILKNLKLIPKYISIKEIAYAFTPNFIRQNRGKSKYIKKIE